MRSCGRSPAPSRTGSHGGAGPVTGRSASGAAPDVVTPRTVADALAAVAAQVPLELASDVTGRSIPRPPGAKYPVRMDLHVVFEPDEQGWVRATIEELPA